MSTGLTNTHTARGFSDLYHVVRSKTMHSLFCITSWLLLCYIDSRFSLPLEQSRTALLGCCLAASCLRAAARWQLACADQKYRKRTIGKRRSVEKEHVRKVENKNPRLSGSKLMHIPLEYDRSTPCDLITGHFFNNPDTNPSSGSRGCSLRSEDNLTFEVL